MNDTKHYNIYLLELKGRSCYITYIVAETEILKRLQTGETR